MLGAMLALSSCASTARVTGDFGDYASYRRTRLATSLEERLGASERYLRQYPQGDYREEVRTWFTPAEKRYFKLAWNNLPRLRAYLDAMPRGPHAEAVTDRISELESRRVFADRREQRVLAHAASIESRLATAAEQRRELVREVSALVRSIAKTRTFGEPTSELDSELLLRFRLRQPPGICLADGCTKTFSFPYAVPELKSLTDRVATATLQITLERGLVRRLTLSGSELLTRLAEAAYVSAVPDNPQARTEALGHAIDVLDQALEEPLPKARCSIDPVSPVILSRRCDGVRLDVSYALDASTQDSLVMSAEKR
jgi:hypothetical protein